jgi:hypothetical protein
MTSNHRRSLTISYSEASSALSCEAAHAFGYTGRLLPDGSTLKAKTIKRVLSAGRAWGAGVANWHAATPNVFRQADAITVMKVSVADDVRRMLDFAQSIEQAQEITNEGLSLMLDLETAFEHYVSLCQPLGNLTRMEDDLISPIPARTGKRSSSRYRYQARIDGFTVDRHGFEWLWECKFRSKLSRHEDLQRSRQLRWYAWARSRETGTPVVGVILDERLSTPPKPPRIVKAKRKDEGIDGKTVSHATDQLCTAEAYQAACEHFGASMSVETYEALNARTWQQRVPIPFTKRELDEAGRELTSVAKTLSDLYFDPDRYPVRNASTMNCNGCFYRQICAHPEDTLLVDQLYQRRVPKHLRDVSSSPTPTNGGSMNKSRGIGPSQEKVLTVLRQHSHEAHRTARVAELAEMTTDAAYSALVGLHARGEITEREIDGKQHWQA